MPTFGIDKGRDDLPQVLRTNAHITIADDKKIVVSRGLHPLHRMDLGVDVFRLAGGEELHRNMRESRGYTLSGLQSFVFRMAGAEENFESGIVLLKEGD